MVSRLTLALGGFLCLLTQALLAQAPDTVTVLFPDGQRTITATRSDGRDLLRLDDVLDLFALERVDDTDDARITVAYRGQSIMLTADQRLVSVAGQLRSLREAPRVSDGAWQVPLSFLTQALAGIYDRPIEVRPRSRLVLVGDVRVPTVTGRYQVRGATGQLSLSFQPEAEVTVSEEGGALVIDVEAEGLDVQRTPDPDGDLVSGFAVTQSPARLRALLGPAFEAFSVTSRTVRDGRLELVLDLRAAASPSAAGPEPAPAPDAVATEGLDPLPDLAARPSLRVVAIDAGHGGDDWGTRSEHALEKDITLSVARRLRDAIQQRLGLRVVLTRSRDENVGLDERAAIANNNKADLFLSLHVNASLRDTVSGAEVFYLGIEEYGAEVREVVDRDAQLVPVIGGGARTIDLVEWEMAQVRYLDRSERLAATIHDMLGRHVPMSARDIQEAPFRVLVGANMPAILIEMGFISNPGDHDRLMSTEFQDRLVDGLVDGILRFRDELERVEPTSASAAIQAGRPVPGRDQ